MTTKDIEALIEKLSQGQKPAERFLGTQIQKALRARYVEQVRFAGLPMGYKANAGRPKTGLHEGYNFREMTPEDLKPYQEALNECNDALWALLQKAYHFNHLPKSPGKAPVASYDPNKRCDARCWNATGFECSCKCGSAFHGMGSEAVKMAMGIEK
jgi:hypothetical protein